MNPPDKMVHLPPREPETVRLDIVRQPAQRTTTILKVTAIVALIVVIVTQMIVLAAATAFFNNLSKLDTSITPATPATTGCPFGDLECGG